MTPTEDMTKDAGKPMRCSAETVRGTSFVALTLFLVCLAVYLLFSYGGIRSPDSEIVYRTARSLAFHHTFAVDQGLESWPGFALVRGVDGQLYSLFQPLEPLLLAPWVYVAEQVSRTSWVERFLPEPPGSHYVSLDIGVMLGLPPSEPGPHRARALVMPFGALVSAASAVFFFLTMCALTGSRRASVFSTVLYAFGTLNLSYAGTLFKEPLVNLFVLASFFCLVWRPRSRRGTWGAVIVSGVVMSLAVATHLMAVPMMPFFMLLAGTRGWRRERPWRHAFVRMAVWALAALPVLLLLAWFNAARFGSVIHTGYDLAVGQSWWQRFRSPLVGVSGLLFSSGKGLLFYSPLVLAGILQWPRLHRADPALSWGLAGMIVARFLFAASYNDWHGGFCIGPRFLVSLVPFLLLPLGLWIRALAQQPNRKSLAVLLAVTWLCISQQIYFALGEVFSFLHHIKWEAARAGVNVFEDGMLYFNWGLSPLLHLLDGNRGPCLMQNIPLGNYSLWLILSGITLLLVLRLTQWLCPGEGARGIDAC